LVNLGKFCLAGRVTAPPPLFPCGPDVTPPPEGTLEWIKQNQLKTLDLVEDLPELLPRVLAMRPDDAPFFARYHYDEDDRLVVTFAGP
jgi:hypothetical protein